MKKTANITPHTFLLEAMRNSSHNTSTAVAEFVDNSIDAEADNIWITFDKKKFVMYISDDGIGMTAYQLINAVSLGCHENADSKLGRFGVGLNTSCTHLGSDFSVYSRTDDGELHRADFNPDQIIQSKIWETPVTDELSDEEREFFNKSIGGATSGTLIVINGINRNFASYQAVNQYGKTLTRNLSEIFRYFLPPQIFGKTEVTEESAKNSRLRLYIDGKCISGRDPLERQAPNTSILKFGEIETPSGNISYTLVEISDADIDVHNYKPDYVHQGVYVVRESRQIMAHDKTIFYQIWGREHSTATHLRLEIKYPKELDNLLQVNHDKVGLKEVEQGTMDKLKEALKSLISQYRASWKSRRSNLPNEEVEKVHTATTKTLESNSNLLNTPNQRKANRKKSEKSEPLVPPVNEKDDSENKKKRQTKNEGEPRNEKVKRFDVQHIDLTAAGPALNFEFEKNNTLVIYWNTSHPFVQKFITLQENAPEETIKGLDHIAFAMAAYWEQAVLEGGDDQWTRKDAFLGVLGQNLRIVQ